VGKICESCIGLIQLRFIRPIQQEEQSTQYFGLDCKNAKADKDITMGISFTFSTYYRKTPASKKMVCECCGALMKIVTTRLPFFYKMP
jgi:hypothetical protein